MPVLVNVSGVNKLFAAEIVLTNITFRVENREKVALVGRNGTGKTTLIKILTGEYVPDGGSVHWSHGAKVGYLQQINAVGSGTVLEEAQAGIQEKVVMQERMAELEAKMDRGEISDEDLEEYARLHEHFAEAEGFTIERDVRSVLTQMGFTEADFDRPTSELSGGQKTRLALSRLLLQEPDLLILDEPTNHLDLQATEWLERWIRQYTGAVLIVSHDRTFLENTVDRVMEIRQTTLKSYPGGFVQYVRLRQEEDARQALDSARQAQEIAKLDEFVRRFMNSQRTAQARGRQKMMNRLLANKIEAPTAERGLKATIKSTERSGDVVAATEKADIGYPGKVLLKGFDWQVRWKERWGVIGDNGTGKSTLIKTLMGDLKPLGGRVRLGANVQPGYFSQDATELDEDMTSLEFMVYECNMDTAPARDLLGRFLISGDDAIRPIKTLSGGEKNKLVLAALTQASPNLLVLDEPTNHLDMDSRGALAEVLKEYNGSLILISHDRWLLGQVTNHILDLKHSGPVVYPGGFDEYRSRNGVLAKPATSASSKAVAVVPTLTQREITKEIVRLESQIGQTEDEIARSEDAVKHVEENLAMPGDSDVMELIEKHTSIKADLARLMGEWEESSTRLAELRGMQGKRD